MGQIHGLAGEIPLLMGGIPSDELGGLPRVTQTVRHLAESMAMPMPAVYLIPADEPNAFATGFSPYDAAISVSSGLLATLSSRELRAVLAHEFGHVLHKHVARETESIMRTVNRISTARGISAGMSIVSIFTAGIADDLLAIGSWSASRRYEKRQVERERRESRMREFQADTTAVQQGLAPWLASALIKLDWSEARPGSSFPRWSRSLLFSDATSLSTHPPINDRLAALGPAPRSPIVGDFCTRCGSVLPDSGACEGCGLQHHRRVCRECSTWASHGDDFCTMCGALVLPWSCRGCGEPERESDFHEPFCSRCHLPLP